MSFQTISTNPPVVLFTDINGNTRLLSALEVFVQADYEETNCRTYGEEINDCYVVWELCYTGQLENAQKLSKFMCSASGDLIYRTFQAGHVHVVRWLMTLKHDSVANMVQVMLYYLPRKNSSTLKCIWWLMATLSASEFWHLHTVWNGDRTGWGVNLSQIIADQTAELAPVRSQFMLHIAPELAQRANVPHRPSPPPSFGHSS